MSPPGHPMSHDHNFKNLILWRSMPARWAACSSWNRIPNGGSNVWILSTSMPTWMTMAAAAMGGESPVMKSSPISREYSRAEAQHEYRLHCLAELPRDGRKTRTLSRPQ